MRRLAVPVLGAALLALLLSAPPARAQAAGEAGEIVLGISEGTSGGTDHARVIAKYGELAERIGAATKQRVRVVFVREFAALEEGMTSGRLTYVMARPSDYPARGLRDHGYRFVATARPDGRCLVFVPKDSPLKSLDEAKDKRWVLPEATSYMARFCTAALRDQGVKLRADQVKHVREQAAVKFFLDGGFGDVGTVASYAGVRKNFEKDGARLLHASVAQPYFPLIASARVPPAQVAALQRALATLDEDERGRELLRQIGIEGFDVTSEARLRALLRWLDA